MTRRTVAHPRRIDWYRALALVLLVSSGIVAALVIGGVTWLALAVFGASS